MKSESQTGQPDTALRELRSSLASMQERVAKPKPRWCKCGNELLPGEVGACGPCVGLMVHMARHD